MALKTHIGDAAGIARKIKKLYAGDADGVARELKALYIGDASGIARKIFQKIKNFLVSLSVSPSGSGSVSGGGTYEEGTSVTVKAAPASGYKFSAWREGSASVSTSASYTFTLSADRTLTALFAKAAVYTPGVNWWETSLPSTASWISVAYGNGKFVAVAQKGDIAAYSTNGRTWTTINLPSSASWTSAANWNSITYGNDRFVIVGSSGNKAAYSTDGITWTYTTISSGSVYSYRSVACGNGKFVAVTSVKRAVNSTDGIAWDTSGVLPYDKIWSSVTYGNGKFVAVANDALSSISAYSTDGIKWTYASLKTKAKGRLINNHLQSMANSVKLFSKNNGDIGGRYGYKSGCIKTR